MLPLLAAEGRAQVLLAEGLAGGCPSWFRREVEQLVHKHRA